ncbi:Broad specificity phosphatase PhoE [Haloechinothrix alba]|uniref:Broad specificity phosphatase PhoE n=1 Tax=Haloechinothrix alba TaxID=664784 RepID=A0A238YF35_9PSEU|nr:histidine phosphatase family protein [Haloechinothrix alba]SNR69582.1 Broad specificity phosphatase PhoE [Haloechinothrix alba]
MSRPGSDSARSVVHLVRHGEVHNPEGILYGRMPGYRLSERGVKQAVTVAETLARHDIVHVVSSPLERAQQTAEPIADAHRLETGTDERLIESDNQFEGYRVSVGNGVLREPRHWWKLRDPFTPSWGEPYTEIARRMLAAVYSAREAAEGSEAVCVSHQLPIWTLRRFLEMRRLWHDPRNRQCSLASVTSLVFRGEMLGEVVYSEPVGRTDPKVTGA